MFSLCHSSLGFNWQKCAPFVGEWPLNVDCSRELMGKAAEGLQLAINARISLVW